MSQISISMDTLKVKELLFKGIFYTSVVTGICLCKTLMEFVVQILATMHIFAVLFCLWAVALVGIP